MEVGSQQVRESRKTLSPLPRGLRRQRGGGHWLCEELPEVTAHHGKASLDRLPTGRVDVRQEIDVVRDLIAEQADCQEIVDFRYGLHRARGIERGLPEVRGERGSGAALCVIEGVAGHFIRAQELAQLTKTIVRPRHLFTPHSRAEAIRRRWTRGRAGSSGAAISTFRTMVCEPLSWDRRTEHRSPSERLGDGEVPSPAARHVLRRAADTARARAGVEPRLWGRIRAARSARLSEVRPS